MRADEYLKRVKKIEALIEIKKEDSSRWFDIAAGIGGGSSSEAVQSTKNPQKMADAVAKRIEIENEIKALEEERKAIFKTLERLQSSEYIILIRFYIYGDGLKKIAKHFNMSYEWAKKKKADGIIHLQEILDEEKE